MYWPSGLRQTGLVILGYALGSYFTLDMVRQLLVHLPAMFISTVLLILFSVLLSLGLFRLTGEDWPSLLIGSIPGGLAQMVVLGEELEQINPIVVTMMQMIRILVVIFLVPGIIWVWSQYGGEVLLSTSDFRFGEQRAQAAPVFHYLLFLLAVIAGVAAAVKLSLPTAYLIGPSIATIIVILLGVPAPELPAPIFILSQLFIGTHLGLQIQPGKILERRKLGLYTLLSSLLLLVFTLLMAFVMSQVYDVSILSAYLSMAPGGIAEMGITAKEVGADLTLVTGYHLFRVFFILLVLAPLLKWWIPRFGRHSGKQGKSQVTL
ncbi:membrane AbrB-like protein [Caldalkalibacillus uzonensis]|uniref:Membrane AbrB-like protein n=1 Tax=Caldalkalibacillus uzonensis TaxID=353224 RepID=A0ABU0CU03_9BACI|nr:membrane AbrB-like protein [Caldalkalibacillus uzonensis]